MSTVAIAAKLCKPTNERGDGGRAGTCWGSKDQIINSLGKPAFDGNIDDKVTISWYIQTPRGTVALRDYWWNAKDEWSIGSSNNKATLWAIRYLRSFGFKASSRIR